MTALPCGGQSGSAAKCGSGGDGLLRERQVAVLREAPERVVGDLPGVAVGIDDDAVVAAPERLGAGPGNPPAGLLGECEERIDGCGRGHVVGERHAAPAAAVGDLAVLRELLAGPQ